MSIQPDFVNEIGLEECSGKLPTSHDTDPLTPLLLQAGHYGGWIRVADLDIGGGSHRVRTQYSGPRGTMPCRSWPRPHRSFGPSRGYQLFSRTSWLPPPLRHPYHTFLRPEAPASCMRWLGQQLITISSVQ